MRRMFAIAGQSRTTSSNTDKVIEVLTKFELHTANERAEIQNAPKLSTKFPAANISLSP